jgi:hypothetical protein
MKNLLIVVLVCVGFRAWGESSSLNLNLPNSPQTYASDRIRAGNFECQNAIGAATNFEFGVVGFLNNNTNTSNPYNDVYNNNPSEFIMAPQNQVSDVGVYAKINIPIGGPKERINCNSLYELELQVKRMEVEKLKQEIKNLRNLSFVDEIEVVK